MEIKGFRKHQADDIIKSINHDSSPFLTHLSCRHSSDKSSYSYYSSENGTHAEVSMINDKEKKGEMLPDEIWISRSPCEDCADLLSARYQPKESTKATIHFAKYYVGSFQKTELFSSPHIQRMIRLMDEGFRFKVWDCTYDFMEFPKIDHSIVDSTGKTHEEMIEETKKSCERDHRILEEAEEILEEAKKMTEKDLKSAISDAVKSRKLEIFKN